MWMSGNHRTSLRRENAKSEQPMNLSTQSPCSRPCRSRHRIAHLLAIALLAANLTTAIAGEDDDWKAARRASCQELSDAYRTTRAAEQQVVTEMKNSSRATTGTNLLGVATLAIVGFGFFTWDDSHTAEENLADLRHDILIITTVAKEKNCTLPAG